MTGLQGYTTTIALCFMTSFIDVTGFCDAYVVNVYMSVARVVYLL